MATENKKYIPALRFPEFHNDGEWKCVIIGDIINTINPPKKLQSSEYKKKGAFPIVDQSASYIAGYSDNGDAVIDNNGYNYIVFGDHTCSLKLIDFPFIQGADGIKIFKSKIAEVLTEYLYQYIFAHPINSKEYKRHFSDLKEKLLLYPTKACEQKKIADCLSSLDKYIEATKRKLELLKEHKRGLMQRLFPDKGKTTPELRFPEFQNDGEWIEVPFGSIINVNSGKDYKHLDVGNIPVYGTGGYMLSVNDRLSDIDAVGIGRKGTIDKPQYLKAPFWTVDTLFFLTSSKNYDIRYLYYLCQTIPWKTYGEQTGVPSLSKTSIDKLDVVITTNLTEQQKIAQSLLHLDNAMDAIEKKIHLLETHKYGLMQNLFPNLNNY